MLFSKFYSKSNIAMLFSNFLFEFKYFYSNSMEYDCHRFFKYLVFQMKNLVFQSKIENLGFRSKYLWNTIVTCFQNTKYFK